MAFIVPPPVHDFPDRAHRQLLEHPANLGELVERVAPRVAAGLMIERAHLLARELPLPDWRRRENDLFFQIPYRSDRSEEAEEVLVGVLVEHQSHPDPAMPLRTLLYGTAYWDGQWKQWETEPGPKGPLRLSPVLPIVFHAGPTPWTTHRHLIDLFAPPEVFRPYVPVWQPVFFDLGEQTPDELLKSPGDWLKTMAAVRADRLDAATYRDVQAEVAKGLEPLADRDKMRWHDLMCFLIAWGKHRRPRTEWHELDQVAEASITNVGLKREISDMSQTLGQTWPEWAQEHYTALGELRAHRQNLRTLLEDRFGPLPEELQNRIEAIADPTQLQTCFRQALHVKTLKDLQF